YPLNFLAERVGGELVSAEDLTPPGADPHDLEIAPATVAVMEQSDVVVYLTGFQPAVDAGVEQISGPVTLDLAEVVDLRDTSGTVHTHEHDDDGHDHDHGPLDPHFWLDPERMATAADAVAEAYAEAAPEHAEEFEAGAAQLRSE